MITPNQLLNSITGQTDIQRINGDIDMQNRYNVVNIPLQPSNLDDNTLVSKKWVVDNIQGVPSIFGNKVTNIAQTNEVLCSTDDNIYISSDTGNIIIDNLNIQGLKDPILQQDAVTLQSMDDKTFIHNGSTDESRLDCNTANQITIKVGNQSVGYLENNIGDLVIRSENEMKIQINDNILDIEGQTPGSQTSVNIKSDINQFGVLTLSNPDGELSLKCDGVNSDLIAPQDLNIQSLSGNIIMDSEQINLTLNSQNIGSIENDSNSFTIHPTQGLKINPENNQVTITAQDPGNQLGVQFMAPIDQLAILSFGNNNGLCLLGGGTFDLGAGQVPVGFIQGAFMGTGTTIYSSGQAIVNNSMQMDGDDYPGIILPQTRFNRSVGLAPGVAITEDDQFVTKIFVEDIVDNINEDLVEKNFIQYTVDAGVTVQSKVECLATSAVQIQPSPLIVGNCFLQLSSSAFDINTSEMVLECVNGLSNNFVNINNAMSFHNDGHCETQDPSESNNFEVMNFGYAEANYRDITKPFDNIISPLGNALLQAVDVDLISGLPSIVSNRGLNMGGLKIFNMDDPISAQQAATKAYVDAAVSGSTSTLNAISVANPTSGNVLMNSHKLVGLSAGTNSGDAINKNQLDTKSYIEVVGSSLRVDCNLVDNEITIDGTFNFNSQQIIGVSDPTQLDNPVNLNYFNNNISSGGAFIESPDTDARVEALDGMIIESNTGTTILHQEVDYLSFANATHIVDLSLGGSAATFSANADGLLLIGSNSSVFIDGDANKVNINASSNATIQIEENSGDTQLTFANDAILRSGTNISSIRLNDSNSTGLLLRNNTAHLRLTESNNTLDCPSLNLLTDGFINQTASVESDNALTTFGFIKSIFDGMWPIGSIQIMSNSTTPSFPPWQTWVIYTALNLKYMKFSSTAANGGATQSAILPNHIHSSSYTTSANTSSAGLLNSGFSTGTGTTGTGTTGTGTTGTGTTGTGVSGNSNSSLAHDHDQVTADAATSFQIGGITSQNLLSSRTSKTGASNNQNLTNHTHNIPGLSVPGLSVPGLSVPGLSVPSLTIPQVTFAGVSIPSLTVVGSSGNPTSGAVTIGTSLQVDNVTMIPYLRTA